MSRQRVDVHTYNPYEARFPARRVVSRDALLLIDEIRAAGYDVHVLPDNGTRLQYLIQKGVAPNKAMETDAKERRLTMIENHEFHSLHRNQHHRLSHVTAES